MHINIHFQYKFYVGVVDKNQNNFIKVFLHYLFKIYSFCSKETDESLNFDEMILEAAKSIAAATSALVKAASSAQRELIDCGKVRLK